MPNSITTSKTYQKMLSDIGRFYESARLAVVEAYWRIGRRIVQEDQRGKLRARYGDALVARLSKDLSKKFGSGFSERNLARMREFYLKNPILPPAAKLTWTQHVELLPVEDPTKRLRLENLAAEKSLKSKELRKLVQMMKNAKPLKLLTPPENLTLRTYKPAEPFKNGCEIDCGFYVFREISKSQYKKAVATDTPSYAYEAAVERVVDGDTLLVRIDLGFGTRVLEKLRLRAIDCPELGTPEGDAAKRFVSKQLPAGARILLKSSKSDLYGRFVADVFFNDQDNRRIYLNNLLLEKGHAVRVD